MNDEIKKRRTFAIISHPDAGKTTLTEKFLLYGGALQLAGSVTARKRQRETASDPFKIGISHMRMIKQNPFCNKARSKPHGDWKHAKASAATAA